ncbi:hypothetical protein [Planctobacterium marinum]|uniref:Uncharacterized protein n=1 Tax=Planctobacterium marinum TaxID=1631968 RepID=A0AA48KQX7_9ALTE|nr:hypothetical protein MACH26_10430 [Planctobacterium marinum]
MNLTHTNSEPRFETGAKHYLAPMLTLLFSGNWLFLSVMQSLYPAMVASQSTTLLLWAGLISAFVSALSFNNKQGE